MEKTPGSIAENRELMALVAQHEANRAVAVDIILADSKYDTAENYMACQQQGIRTHNEQD